MPTAPTNLTVDDIRGRQFDLSFTDNASSKDGYRVYTGPDGYLEFDGSSQYVQLSDVNHDLSTSGAIYVEFRGPPQGGCLLIDRYASGYGYALYYDGGDINTRWAGYGSSTGVDPMDGKWHGLLLNVNSNGDLNLHYDEPANTIDSGSNVGDASKSTDTEIGSRSGNGLHFEGDIRRVAFSHSSLSTSEQEEIFNGQTPEPLFADYWFNEGGGNTLTDYISGYDGSLVNSPTWHGGGDIVQDGSDLDPQYSLDFEQDNNEYVDIPTPSFSGSFAIGAFFRAETLGTGSSDSGIVELAGGSSDFNPLFNIRLESDGDIKVYARDDSTNIGNTASAYTATTGELVSAIWSYDESAGEFTLYINGSEDTTKAFGQMGTTTFGFARIGSTADPRYFDGEIEHAFIASDSVSPSEASSFHNDKQFPSNLIAAYPSNNGSGTTLSDTSGNSNDGTINGATWTAPIAPIHYTTTDLLDGEKYVVRSSAFEGTTEEFDQ